MTDQRVSDSLPTTAASIPYEGTDCTPEEAVEAVKAVRTTAAPRYEHKGVNVSIDVRRWNVYVTIRDSQGVLIQEYVASADSGITYGDGVFFGNRDEYEDAMQDA